jgi:hypothetical protein
MSGDAEVIGKYPLAFAESAGEVSPVFERKLRDIMADHGLEDVVEDDWVPLQAVIDTYAATLEEAGSATMRQAGIQNGRVIDWPPEVETPQDGLAALDDIHQAAFRGGSDYPAGRYIHEARGNREARMGLADDYVFPKEIGAGAFRGVVESLANGTATVTVEEVDAAPGEMAAFVVTW